VLTLKILTDVVCSYILSVSFDVLICCNCGTALLQVLHPQSMRPAREGDIPVRVKNSYNPQAPGTLITSGRDLSKVCILAYPAHRYPS